MCFNAAKSGIKQRGFSAQYDKTIEVQLHRSWAVWYSQYMVRLIISTICAMQSMFQHVYSQFCHFHNIVCVKYSSKLKLVIVTWNCCQNVEAWVKEWSITLIWGSGGADLCLESSTKQYYQLCMLVLHWETAVFWVWNFLWRTQEPVVCG